MPKHEHPDEANVELSTFVYVSKRRSHPMASDENALVPSGESDPGDVGEAEEIEETGEMAESDNGDDISPDASLLQRDDAQKFLAEQADQGQNFTVRGVLVGLVIGVIICFSNTYFGLQTGWISGMAMPAALIGFGFFKTVARCIDYPFTPVENVLVQTVAGALGTMPLGCGFVGVLPALQYLLKPEENGPLVLSTAQLIVWGVGICFFGVVFAVPLRKEVIIREKLKFPSGTATALIIGVLHGDMDKEGKRNPDSGIEIFRRRSQDLIRESGEDDSFDGNGGRNSQRASRDHAQIQCSNEEDHRDDWKARIRLLIIAFGVSAIYVSRKLIRTRCVTR